MGKKLNWFRKLFGGGKKQSDESEAKPKPGKDKNVQLCSQRPYGTECSSSSSYTTTGVDASKHAIVVAAATAAVAEAAVAAAKAAAEVVRLTSGPGRFTSAATASYVGGSGRFWEVVAAIKIQSAFRAYLARRALRALKALVKLQALVRGHIVRKQTAETLRCMQSLVRVQSHARASRARLCESSQSSIRSSQSHHHTSSGPVHQSQTKTNKFDRPAFGNKYGSNSGTNESGQGCVRYGSNWLDRWMKESSPKGYAHDDGTDKILEIDTCKPNFYSKQGNRSSQKSNHGVPYGYHDRPSMPFFPQNHIPSMPFADSSSLSSLVYQNEKDDATSWTAENSPQVFSASSRPGSSTKRSGFSPTKSEFSRSFFKGYSGHPNYMANTESYRAKVRSQSAPRQRVELEKFGSTRRSIHGFSNMMASSQDFEDLRR